MKQEVATQAIDVTIASAASKTAVGGGSVAVFGALTMNELAMVIGMIVGVIGLVVQMLAQWHAFRARTRDERRKDELHQARLQALRAGVGEGELCDTDRADL